MFIVHHTVKYVSHNNETFTDNYQLADTREEAREIVQGLIGRLGDDLYCYSISKVLEASEPHWVEEREDEAQTLADNAWGTDK